MFDSLPTPPPTAAGGLAQRALGASTIRSWQQDLVAALDAPSGLEDAGRVEALRALEELICTATAAQASLAAELDRSQCAEQERRGVPAARRGQGVAAQVAWARRESPHRGQRHLSLARVVPIELPKTWAAWRAGRITEWRATLIVRETACLSREDRLAVDAEVAGHAEKLEAMGDRRAAAATATEAARLDPASVVLRRRRAEADRHVGLRPAPDTMTWLTALLPVKDGVAAFAALSKAADSARAVGDPRSRGQVMADALVDGVLSSPGGATRPLMELGLVMTDHALFAGLDDPAHLDGYGPIPAELAHEILADALDADTGAAIRRLYTSPETGELVAMDSRARTFRGNLRRFVRLRDRTCRTPWCEAPIRHDDHVEEHSRGGPTSLTNAQGLCVACNHAKQAPGWRARSEPSGEVVTTMPTGHTYRSRAPVMATVRPSPIRIDYVLAG